MNKALALLAAAIGLAIVAALLALNHAGRVAGLIAGAGWGLVLVILLHLPQTVASGLGWRALVRGPDSPGAGRLVLLRWIREGVNALLPVAQVGGDVVRARLLGQIGVPIGRAAASVTVDLAMELASQAVFTLIGLALLIASPGARAIGPSLAAAAVLGLFVAAGLVVAQRRGALKRLGEALARLAERRDWSALKGVERLHDEMMDIYRQPALCLRCAGWHLASWLLGSLETFAALAVLGLHPNVREAMVVESLGQLARAVGFAIPGALGVQEGGYVLVCALFGIGASDALALSLIRRIRELALGAPALIAWHRLEHRRAAAKRTTTAPGRPG